MIKIALCGAAGRMGREIISAGEDLDDIKIIAGIEAKGNRFVNKKISSVEILDDLLNVINDVDCIVEFTNPSATMDNLKKNMKFKKSYVIGTTGFTENEIEEIKKLSSDFAIFLSSNMSLAVNLLYHLVVQTTKILAAYDIEIIETHHRGKRDAPSGTAKAIAQKIKEHRQNVKLIYGREGMPGERKKEELGISAVRGGDVVGEHRVLFLGNGEFLELRHFATSRKCFAQGTFEAVRFIVHKKHGLYTMNDLVSI